MSENEKYPKRVVIEGYPSPSDTGIYLFDKAELSGREFLSMNNRNIPDTMYDTSVPKYRLTLTRIDPPKKKGGV